MSTHSIELTVNGRRYAEQVEARLTLADLLRERLDLTATHLGCEHGVCGACTVLVNGSPVSACTYLAYEARDRHILTIEGLSEPAGPLHPLQQAFIDENGFQCGFCTPGMIMAAKSLLDRQPDAGEADIISYMDGNLCRCTGYRPIVRAIQQAQRLLAERDTDV